MSDSDRQLANNMMPLAVEASVVVVRTLEAVRNDELHILTHVEFSQVVERRAARISEAFGRLDHSLALDA